MFAVTVNNSFYFFFFRYMKLYVKRYVFLVSLSPLRIACNFVRQLVTRGSDQLESLTFGHCAHFTFDYLCNFLFPLTFFSSYLCNLYNYFGVTS